MSCANYQARYEWKLRCLARGLCRHDCDSHHPCQLRPERDLTRRDLAWLRAEKRVLATAQHLRDHGLEQSAQAAEALADLIRDEGVSA